MSMVRKKVGFKSKYFKTNIVNLIENYLNLKRGQSILVENQQKNRKVLSEFLSQRELFEFDENGLPNPPSEQELDELITNFSLELNEDLCACSVCDELRPKSECAFVCPCQ